MPGRGRRRHGAAVIREDRGPVARDGATVRRDPAGPLPAVVDAREPRGEPERPPRLRPDDPIDPQACPPLEAADGEVRRAAEPPVGPVDPEAVALQRVLDGAHPHAALALRAHARLDDERVRGAGGVRRGVVVRARPSSSTAPVAIDMALMPGRRVVTDFSFRGNGSGGHGRAHGARVPRSRRRRDAEPGRWRRSSTPRGAGITSRAQ